MSALTEHQQAIATAVMAQESASRRHVVITLSGSHAYGFPSPDSDLDIKASHIAPTQQLLGLSRTIKASDRLEVIEGVEIDYTSNEIGALVSGILGGNGNYLERVLGELVLQRADEHEELAAHSRASISRMAFRHYQGFAKGQWHDFQKNHPTAKRLLYVLRTVLTGVHLMTTGELRVALEPNALEYGYADATELIVAKRAGENVELDEKLAKAWRKRVGGLFELLEKSRAASPLPEKATNAAEFEEWLIDLRIRELGR